ncbi:GntR family transcriptional regulator [Siccirubricoccus deserti]
MDCKVCRQDETLAAGPRLDPRIAGASGPIYLAIADAIGAAITAGVLRPGERLPTHRALADALGVDLTTITRAYAEARRRGLLQATVGRGTFVRGGQAPAPQPRPEESGGPVDLGMNMPPQPTDPPLRDLLQRGMSALLARADAAAILTYRTGAAAPRSVPPAPHGCARPSARWSRRVSWSAPARSPRCWPSSAPWWRGAMSS